MTHTPKTGAALVLATAVALLAALTGCQSAETGGGAGASAAASAATQASPVTAAVEQATPIANPSSGGTDADAAVAAAKVVEAYLQARVEANVDKMITLSCADWESEARKEAASLRGVKAKLDGLTCQALGESGDAVLVACQGDIIATYNGEDRALSVAKRAFKTAVEGGEWRMCGYE